MEINNVCWKLAFNGSFIINLYNIINAYHFSIIKVLAEFNNVDKDGNLNLDKREFSNLYIKLNGLAPNESTNKIDYIFDAFDKDKNGFYFYSRRNYV